MSRFSSRIARFRTVLVEEDIEAAILVGRENTRYLSGFSGSESVLVIGPSMVELLVDFRYLSQAAAQCPDCRVVDVTADRSGTLAETLKRGGYQRIGLEEGETPWAFHRNLQASFPDISLFPLRGRTNGLRERKDVEELESIREAVRIADRVMEFAYGLLHPGMSENEAAGEIEAAMRRFGAEGTSFATIVASGPRSALPHGIASERVMQSGDPVVMDFGCRFDGYCSDLTRTVFLGRPDPELADIYRIVLESQKKGIEALQPGRSGRSVDAVSRQSIEDAGYGAFFGHGLGHGVGIAIHEDPRLSRSYEGILEVGNIVTIEPGIYLPDRGGVRIEDMAVVTADGCAVLTAVSKEMLML